MFESGLHVTHMGDTSAAFALAGSRPLRTNKRTGQVQIATERGLTINSLLMRDEWTEVDNAVLDAAFQVLRAVPDLRSRGLRHALGSMASVVSRYYVASEVTAANVTMSGRGGANRDLPEITEIDVPVPVIFKDFEIDQRALMASRRLGDGLDLSALRAASQVVAETQEDMLLGNLGAFKMNGTTIYGYRTHPNRNTATASGLGAGVWSTIGNILPTILGMLNMAKADNHNGPYVLYVGTAAYINMLATYADNTGQTPYQRALNTVPELKGVVEIPRMPANECVMVQMDANTVDFAEPNDMPGIQVREWSSPDGLAANFKVMSVFVPRVKSRQDTKSGIQHVTGI